MNAPLKKPTPVQLMIFSSAIPTYQAAVIAVQNILNRKHKYWLLAKIEPSSGD